MMKKISILLTIFFLINILTMLVYLFRKYYIIYHNFRIYSTISLLMILIIIMEIIIWKDYDMLLVLTSIMGASLLLAVPLSFYPNIVNNPDVIKMLQLTSFILQGNFELARHIDYSAFPGFSYLFGITSIITGIPIGIKFASLMYILFSVILLVVIVALGRYSHWGGMYLLIVFSLGFVYSFDYLSPQLLGQILLITSLLIMLTELNVELSISRFTVLLICYAGTVITHPESAMMLLFALIFYLGFTNFVVKNSPIITLFGKIMIIFTILISYMFFFVPSFGPSYILRAPLVILFNIKEFMFQLLNFGHKTRYVVTSSSIKPFYIKTLSNINIVYNFLLLLLSAYIFKKHKRKFFKHVVLMLSFFASAGIFLFIFGFSFGQFIGRPAFAVSLILAILISQHLIKVQRKTTVIFAIVSIFVLLFATFPARVAPQEWNVHSENYYPPMGFINYCTKGEVYTFYFLYPNPGISINQANYIILPIGQIEYVSGMSKFFGWDAQKSMRKIIMSSKYQGIIYENKFSLILWRDNNAGFNG